jgi:hypothetical protein
MQTQTQTHRTNMRVGNTHTETDGSSRNDRGKCSETTPYLVVLTEGCDENDGGDVVEAVNPLLTLVSLATHVVHAAAGMSTHSQQGKKTMTNNNARQFAQIQNGQTAAEAARDTCKGTHTKSTPSMRYASSTMPDVRTRDFSRSSTVATYPGAEILSTMLK